VSFSCFAVLNLVCGVKLLAQLFGQSRWTFGGEVDATVDGVALGEEFAVAEHVHVDADLAALGGMHGASEFEEVIVERGALVVDVGFDDGESETFRFHFPIGHGAGTHEFVTATFKEGKIVAVIDDSHLVGVGVGDAVGCRAG